MSHQSNSSEKVQVHTPGPWGVQIRDGGINKYAPSALIQRLGVPEEQRVVARIDWSAGYRLPEEDAVTRAIALANAKLIAAAPDLLAALRDADAFISGALPVHAMDRDEAVSILLPRIRTAIQRATT